MPADDPAIDPVVAAALARVPGFAAERPVASVRLGGLTNVNHLVTLPSGRYVVRIPGHGTGEYIDRVAEAHAATAAASAGVNVEVVHFDASDGLMLTRFVEAAATMSASAFGDLGAVARAGAVIRRLHTSVPSLRTDFDLFAMVDDYLGLLTRRGAPLPDGYADLRDVAERTRRALEARPRPRVAAHCDPLCENFLDTGERMYLIDYEYAGNNDPMWDLGDLSVEGGFSAEQDAALLAAYFDGPPPPTDHSRMVAYKAMCDLLWTLWGVIQHVDGNPAEDFWQYAVGRFERCRNLMAGPAYLDHLARITAG